MQTTGQDNAEEVGFYQLIRQQLRQLEATTSQRTRQFEAAVRGLLDESTATQPAIDIYTAKCGGPGATPKQD
jgi:hypothetical protein